MILAATVERILPSDDGPGAVETGAAAYIERLLDSATSPAARATLFRALRQFMDQGAIAMEDHSLPATILTAFRKLRT